MNTIAKGNKLKDQLHDYSKDQMDLRELVFDASPATLCKALKKKGYFCKERGRDVEFDVIIELRRSGRREPHLLSCLSARIIRSPFRNVTLLISPIRSGVSLDMPPKD